MEKSVGYALAPIQDRNIDNGFPPTVRPDVEGCMWFDRLTTNGIAGVFIWNWNNKGSID